MDLSLCIIDKENKILQFAGAHNPLIYFRNGELHEIKADKMPIGIHASEEMPFTNHVLEIEKDDIFYMFSDGYHDQLGGDKRRKFMKKPFKRLLGKIHQKPLAEQKEILDKENIDWIGNYEQIDDIIVVGFKI
jgi:serine phosphatase RsbU (regulator of sigma subunit)